MLLDFVFVEVPVLSCIHQIVFVSVEAIVLLGMSVLDGIYPKPIWSWQVLKPKQKEKGEKEYLKKMVKKGRTNHKFRR